MDWIAIDNGNAVLKRPQTSFDFASGDSFGLQVTGARKAARDM